MASSSPANCASSSHCHGLYKLPATAPLSRRTRGQRLEASHCATRSPLAATGSGDDAATAPGRRTARGRGLEFAGEPSRVPANRRRPGAVRRGHAAASRVRRRTVPGSGEPATAASGLDGFRRTGDDAASVPAMIAAASGSGDELRQPLRQDVAAVAARNPVARRQRRTRTVRRRTLQRGA